MKHIQSLISKRDKFILWMDEIKFSYIFILWICAMMAFGILYHYSSGSENFLSYTKDGSMVASIKDAVYFSFITATTTGFGDITPHGAFKLIAICQAVFGFILLAIVTSKLISVKQNMILGEIYEISFTERVNRLRSSLMLFRQHCERMLYKVEHKGVSPVEIKELYIYISQFEDTLNDLSGLIEKSNKEFTISLDAINAEIIMNSIITSFEKMQSLIKALDGKKFQWRRGITTNLIQASMASTNEVFEKMKSIKDVEPKALDDMVKRKDSILRIIEKRLK